MDLHYLHRYPFWSAELKVFINKLNIQSLDGKKNSVKPIEKIA